MLTVKEHTNYISFILIKLFSAPSAPVDVGGVMLEQTTPIMMEMFHHFIKETKELLIDPSLLEDMLRQIKAAKK